MLITFKGRVNKDIISISTGDVDSSLGSGAGSVMGVGLTVN